jgi:RNA polymerase-binding transcription factor DksA
MPGKPVPVPHPPRPDLLLSLPTLRARLEEQRQFRIEQIDSLSGADGVPLPVGGNLTNPLVDTARDQVTAALLAGARQALADIDTALYRIFNGEYGNCLTCGQPIDMQRLSTLPQTALCADCHRRHTTGGVERASRPGPVAGVDRTLTADATFADTRPGRDATLTM